MLNITFAKSVTDSDIKLNREGFAAFPKVDRRHTSANSSFGLCRPIVVIVLCNAAVISWCKRLYADLKSVFDISNGV